MIKNAPLAIKTPATTCVTYVIADGSRYAKACTVKNTAMEKKAITVSPTVFTV